MRFTAIDFETANSNSGSICAVGIAVVEDESVVEKKYWLVRPHRDMDYFDPFNITIHGITPAMVRDADTFESLYHTEILPRIGGTMIAGGIIDPSLFQRGPGRQERRINLVVSTFPGDASLHQIR